MAFWLGTMAAFTMFSVLNPIVWIWSILLSGRSDHLGRPLEIASVNMLSLGALLLVKANELGVKPVDWIQAIIGSIVAGIVVHFLMHFVSRIFRNRKSLAAGAAAAGNRMAHSVRSQLDQKKRFSPDNYADGSYAKAMEEIDSGQLIKSTWAKSIAVSDGDMAKAQANYIIFRVKELENPGA